MPLNTAARAGRPGCPAAPRPNHPTGTRPTADRGIARTLAFAAVLALSCVIALSGTAAAHAELVGSTPLDRAVLGSEPSEVTLVFSEQVTLALSTVTVIGPSGRRVDGGASAVPGSGGERIRVLLAPDRDHGTFVVGWRATAADDGHTTSGAFTFSVGAPSRTGGTPLTTSGRDRLTDAVLDVAVWLGFAGLAGLVGSTAIRFSGSGPELPREDPAEEETQSAPWESAAPSWAGVRRAAVAGWALLLAGTVLQLLVHGPAAQGASLRRVADRSLLSATLAGHVGHTLVARIMLLALVAAVGQVILRHRRAGAAGALVLTLLLALTWSETSHAPSGSLVPLALAVTTLHVTAMAVWAGGAACLLVLTARGGEPEVAVAALRFSRPALVAVLVLAATGLCQAYREVGGPGALTGTPYGRLLLAKVALVLVVLAAAAGTHRRVRRRGTPAAGAEVRRSLLVELAGITGVLVVTVLLIGTAPAHVPHGGGTVTDPAPAASVPR